jgi:hypothetical protein
MLSVVIAGCGSSHSSKSASVAASTTTTVSGVATSTLVPTTPAPGAWLDKVAVWPDFHRAATAFMTDSAGSPTLQADAAKLHQLAITLERQAIDLGTADGNAMIGSTDASQVAIESNNTSTCASAAECTSGFNMTVDTIKQLLNHAHVAQ